MFGIVDTSSSSKKLKAFVHAEYDGAKDSRSVLIYTLFYLDTIGSPTTLPINKDLTTEVTPLDASSIGLEIKVVCKKCGDRTRTTMC